MSNNSDILVFNTEISSKWQNIEAERIEALRTFHRNRKITPSAEKRMQVGKFNATAVWRTLPPHLAGACGVRQFREYITWGTRYALVLYGGECHTIVNIPLQ